VNGVRKTQGLFVVSEFLNRRRILFSVSSLLATSVVMATAARAESLYGDIGETLPFRDESQLPPSESPIDFEIELSDLSEIPERFHRQTVPWEGVEAPGTIVVDPAQRFLYLVQDNGQAIRYGVGVGRQGFAWHGEAQIGMKRKWPRWLPPEDMVVRDEKAKTWMNGMPGGPENPLGARALYLFANGADTLYRIHGTNDPESIGKAMSSGCVRMLNEDVADLFERVGKGTKVIVLQADI
jgi:lipoprotein-anchoring transpeptidase ErfK/SrfK